MGYFNCLGIFIIFVRICRGGCSCNNCYALAGSDLYPKSARVFWECSNRVTACIDTVNALHIQAANLKQPGIAML